MICAFLGSILLAIADEAHIGLLNIAYKIGDFRLRLVVVRVQSDAEKE